MINKILFFVCSLGGACVLLGCSSNKNLNPKATQENNIQTDSGNPDSFDSATAETLQTENSPENSLAVDPHRCIGCGKCVQVAPNNFEMENRKAVVISGEMTAQTTQAINICPAKAIVM